MTLHIELGHRDMENITRLADKSVRFVNDDGRPMFEVTAGEDGKSINVRGCGSTKVNGVVYIESLYVLPNASNHIDVMVRPYE